MNERKPEPTVVKFTNQIVSLMFDNIRFFEFLIFLGGATSFCAGLKAYKSSIRKSCPLTTDLILPKDSFTSHFPCATIFLRVLLNCNLASKINSYYQNFMTNACKTAEALKKTLEKMKILQNVKKSMRAYSRCGLLKIF